MKEARLMVQTCGEKVQGQTCECEMLDIAEVGRGRERPKKNWKR